MKFPTDQIINWYKSNKRDLPWRQDKDPYHVWISEIMLQQTRIEAVIPYYYRFIKELPSIKDLASVDTDKLLKLWEGLGYYSRAQNVKKAAIIIEEKFKGIFPTNYNDILSLPGIGEYTASAIGSICFSLKEITVDGNVLRVYMRYFGKKDCVDDNKVKSNVRKELMNIVPTNSGDFNQGIMELGETVCLVGANPKCSECPIQKGCKTYHNKNFDEIPVKRKKETKKVEYYTILLFIYKNKIGIQKRKETGILKNMYEFPNTSQMDKQELENYITSNKIPYSKIEIGPTYTHVFTHKKWSMNSYIIYLKEEIPKINFKTIEEVEKEIAIPTAFKPFFTYINHL